MSGDLQYSRDVIEKRAKVVAKVHEMRIVVLNQITQMHARAPRVPRQKMPPINAALAPVDQLRKEAVAELDEALAAAARDRGGADA